MTSSFGIRVEVTQHHIDAGVRRNLFRDPISLAIKEQLRCKWAMTGWGYATTEDNGGTKTTWSLEDATEVGNFLRDFDSARTVAPIVVSLLPLSTRQPKVWDGKVRRYKGYLQSSSELPLRKVR